MRRRKKPRADAAKRLNPVPRALPSRHGRSFRLLISTRLRFRIAGTRRLARPLIHSPLLDERVRGLASSSRRKSSSAWARSNSAAPITVVHRFRAESRTGGVVAYSQAIMRRRRRSGKAARAPAVIF